MYKDIDLQHEINYNPIGLLFVKKIFFLPSSALLWTLILGYFLPNTSVLAESYQSSPYHYFLEIKFGAYLPHLDNSQSLHGKTPYSDIFGNSNDPKGASPGYGLLSQIEFDYQFFHHKTGSFGIGFNVGYFRKTGWSFVGDPKDSRNNALCHTLDNPTGGSRLFKDAAGNPLNADTCISGDNSFLNIFPVSLLFVYRFEYFQTRWHVPIIPYIKAGFGYFLWWFGDSNSALGTYPNPGTGQTLHAIGASVGLVFHPGIAIDLGAIDRPAGKTFAQEFHIHRLVAFIEMNGAWINNFTDPHSLDLSDISFNAGLGFEF